MERYEAGLILHGQSNWQELIGNVDFQEFLFQRVKESNPEGRVCTAVSRNLTAILRGELDALTLLFNDTLLDDYYQWGFENGKGSTKIASYLNAFAHKNPDLNILEIGARTGSGTKLVMNALNGDTEGMPSMSRYSKFMFIDISPSFFEKATDKLEGRTRRINFKVLDISSDPEEQGFENTSYDLVIAVNVGVPLIPILSGQS